jgi:hypothetical protein
MQRNSMKLRIVAGLGVLFVLVGSLTACTGGPDSCPLSVEQIEKATGATSVHVIGAQDDKNLHFKVQAQECIYELTGSDLHIDYLLVVWGVGGKSEIQASVETYAAIYDPDPFTPEVGPWGANSVRAITNSISDGEVYVDSWLLVGSNVVFLRANGIQGISSLIDPGTLALVDQADVLVKDIQGSPVLG